MTSRPPSPSACPATEPSTTSTLAASTSRASLREPATIASSSPVVDARLHRPNPVSRPPESSPKAARPRPRSVLTSNKSSSAVPTLSTINPLSPKMTTSHTTGATSGAADLLRQAMMQRGAPEDEGPDSTSSTPPGAMTPRPDPTDKRLPGILHSYFGQVRDSFMPRRTSSAMPSSLTSASSAAAQGSELSEKEKEKEPDNAGLRSTMLPSPPPSTTSRAPSASQLNGEAEKLTGDFAPQGQATPPQTPRTRSQEGKSKPSSLSRTSLVSNTSTASKENKEEPVVSTPKGKLAVTISEGRGLRPSVDPYVVCQFQWAEYISDGPRHDPTKKGRPTAMQMRRTESEMGRPMAIPMKSRQSSHSGNSSDPKEDTSEDVTSPKWEHEAIFDVVGDHAEIDISVYDRSNGEAFLGHVRFCPNLVEYEHPYDGWFHLEPRDGEGGQVTGEVHLKLNFHKTDKKHFGPEDFEILKLIGKGTFGQVFQVRKRDTRRIYAMKVLSKKVIVQKKEVAHTLGERNILVRTAMADSHFIVGLKFSFQTPSDLYLVTDYMSGGELFWHLQREGRFQEARAKFYIAELILALQHLHDHDIVYRDLKPENILLDANGHIALCDFGLSKANLTENATTNTFCGTTEYLAPEVLLDEQGYTKMVDFWSLGVLVFEMCCGWSPFYAEDTQQMYKNIAFGKVRFPRDALSTEGRNFVKGLLNRNPKHRLGATRDAEELKAHPFFADIDWVALAKKNVVPPFKPKLKGELDVSNFDPEFTNALNGNGSLNARAAALSSGINPASTPLSPTMQANFKGFTFTDQSTLDQQFAHSHREDLERMDEDEKDDVDWDKPAGRGDRMSGVIPSNDHDIFNHGNFDV
ncbi:Pkinase-domain-containing protein [Dothidotthia symphoricarpi CBS 119687]|uniref:non-specific serine/threonine protein kinase n=1 Tax=Dothidotthia symphoricarpi CBS 119687 TaxID=1392245 RepID=A0A6A6ANU5_9PLEO|nr:Pkinase-domain-containing protein [Dothidotthia symphoricarpi CBS 119687]KAF2133470.1 Pkinase-domain-containing protein [Dothidotthia symphoricarpi CBS 119687]